MKKQASAVVFLAEDLPQLSTDEKIRICAAEYCRRARLPYHAEKFAVAREKRGKPYFPMLPELPFSVSHSGSRFAVAFSSVPIGMDLQYCDLRRSTDADKNVARLCKIAARFFPAEESAYVAADPQRRFFLLWTARESRVKLSGSGIDGTFSTFGILPANADLLEQGDALLWQAEGLHYTAQMLEGYALCICTECPCPMEIVPFSLKNSTL